MAFKEGDLIGIDYFPKCSISFSKSGFWILYSFPNHFPKKIWKINGRVLVLYTYRKSNVATEQDTLKPDLCCTSLVISSLHYDFQ
jgi:hypothetical protein